MNARLGAMARRASDDALDTALAEPDKFIDRLGRRVNPMGACLEIQGAPIKGGYIRVRVGGAKVLAHRLVWALVWKRNPRPRLALERNRYETAQE